MRHNRSAALVLDLALVLAGFGFPELLSAAETAFRYARRIELPSLTEPELIAVPLDADVFEAVRDGFPDLRLLDAEGRPVPYLLRTAAETRAETSRRWITVAERSARPLSNGGLEIILRLDRDAPAVHGARIISPLNNFEHHVRVFGSDDGENWTLLSDDGLIFDYAQFIDVRNETIPLPEIKQRQLRIVIDDVTAEQQSRLLELTRQLRGSEESGREERLLIDRRPFRVDKVELWNDVLQQRTLSERRIAYPIASFRTLPGSDTERTVLEITTRREPLTKFTLRTPEINFTRGVSLEIPVEAGIQTLWKPHASGRLSHLDFKELQRDERSLTFSEARQSRYRLVIENGDSPPLEITGVDAEGNVKELLFFAAPGAELRLVYGSPDAAAAQFDTAAIAAALEKGYAPQPAPLGPRVAFDTAARTPRVADLLANPWVLSGIIGVLALLLGWLLFQAGERLRQLPSDSDSGTSQTSPE